MFKLFSKNLRCMWLRCLKPTPVDVTPISFILTQEGYLVTHTPTHTAQLFTLISGLFFPSPIYFLLLFQVSSSSFLPSHPLNSTTHRNPEFCSQVVFQNQHFPPFPSERLLHALFLLGDHLLTSALQSFSNLYLPLQRFRPFFALPFPSP